MAHSKAALQKLSQRQLIATIMFLLTWLKVNDPKAYHAAEARAGLTDRHSGTSKKRRGKKKRSAKQIAATRKLVRFNKANKRSALAKMRRLDK